MTIAETGSASLEDLHAKATQAADSADWPEMLRCWQAIQAQRPDDPSAYWGIGSALGHLGRREEAEALLAAAMIRFPKEAPLAAVYASLASQRLDWPEALRRWQSALSRPGAADNPHWQAAHAEALLELGRLDEAETIFRRLSQADPEFVRAEVGLARVDMARRDWAPALARWDDILARFHATASPYWHLSRALALRQLDRRREAELILRELVRADPKFRHARWELVQTLMSAGQFEAALGAVSSGIADGLADPALVEKKIDILIRLQRIGEARNEFKAALARATEAGDLDALFTLIPRLFDDWPRTQAWLTMQQRLGEMARDGHSAAVGATLGLRLLLALRDYAGFLREFDRLGDAGISGKHRDLLRSVATTVRATAFPDRLKPKIFGIGLPKTGQSSLSAALTTLGLATAQWTNPLTGALLDDADVHLFDALTDSPVCARFEQYYYLFPHARFLYTVRPLDAWRISWCRHLQRIWGISDFGHIKRLLARRESFHHGARYADIDLALYFNHEDYDSAYRAYDARVRNFFRDKPKDRFLELDIFGGDGWPELCGFLGRPPPAEPFPWQNRAPPG